VGLEPLVRVLVAMGLAIAVGLDRELRGKPAGLRTHVVVATASAALDYVSIVGTGSSDVSDQTRIAAQVVSGIGFMGAGVIFASSGRFTG
jgi:putative Mg2+ transporter-C (MgtC) family protein